MTLEATAQPASATCGWIDTRGTCVTITATAVRGASALAPLIKCEVAGQPRIAERLREVVGSARLCEPRHDTRWRVRLHVAPVPIDAEDPNWELAAVLADRMARGIYRPLQRRVYAHGTSAYWPLGQLSRAEKAPLALQTYLSDVPGHCLSAPQDSALAVVAIPAEGIHLAPEHSAGRVTSHDWTYLSHLGGLNGQPDPAQCVARARAWFPLISGGDDDAITSVDVAVRPIEPDDAGALAAPTDEPIDVHGVGFSQRHDVASVLKAARMLESHDGRPWRTTVSFGRAFELNSYQLALVLADRLARGRLLPPRGRLIATGASSNWADGHVETVGGLPAKCRLIVAHVASGDRVLVPAAWLPQLPAGFSAELRQRGASVAGVERLLGSGANALTCNA